MPSQPAAADHRRPGWGLTLLYVVALSTVAVLSLGAQWLIQRQLSNGESDSRVINIAGRQRMLSQELAKAALRTDSTNHAGQEAREEMREALQEWTANHRALQSGDEALRLKPTKSHAMTALFETLEPHFIGLSMAAEQLIASDATEGAVAIGAVEAIQLHEGPFLLGMDAIVSQLVVEAEERVARLRRLEFWILMSTLAVLLAEGLLIFRPAVRRIAETVGRLESTTADLCHAKDEAERANAAKSRFLANVSHELRTPMTAVLGMTELAQRATDDATRDAHLAVVEEAGESLLNLLNDLIDLARIDADQIDLKEAPFDPTELVERTIRLMRPSADEKRIELNVEGDGPAPRVWGDEKRLGQVLLNLIGNAIKWTDQGSVTVDCRATNTGEGRVALALTVIDTGVGIDPAEQRRVFEPFAQASSAESPKRGGAGLGLSICQRLIETMGGTIQLTSAPGEGTTVRVVCELPLAAAAITLQPIHALVAEGPGVRVLLIEDTVVNQKLLQATLEEAGHRVTVCSDGESGLAVYRQGRFDLVLTDLQLPDLDGVTVAERVRELAHGAGAKAPPIVCVTAHAGPSAPLPSEESFDEVLVKPVRRDTLLGMVTQLTSGSAPSGTAVDENEIPATLQQELAEAFVVAAPGQLVEFQAAIDRVDWVGVRVIAHRFGGQVAYFDEGPLRGRLDRLEDACQRRSTATASELARSVVSDLRRLVDRLR